MGYQTISKAQKPGKRIIKSDAMISSMRLFLASFLVLFLEVALIRWMPAYIRLLSYFSNFILLASFLGIGLGCLLANLRTNLFAIFPLLEMIVVGAVAKLRLEVTVPTSTDIYFSSGTAEKVLPVESTVLLPILFVAVAALFVALAQRMGKEMTKLPPLKAYTINILGSLAGVIGFALASWLEMPPTAWFGVACLAALPLLLQSRPLIAGVNVALLAASVLFVHSLSQGTLWSPYYKITLRQEGAETVLEVNNIWHQSMAPLDQKEYFYQWPYMVFGDTFEDVLILGAGSGTDVAAALRHNARRVDAVEIDPTILRLGKTWHPEKPYSDPRVRTVSDDARHFLRTTERSYDLVVFALIDSLTLQSSFSSVRLESYMFTEESFRAVRDHLKPNGVLVIYNYFRERWLVDRIANIAAKAFGEEPRVHVHEKNAFLAVMMVGPRVQTLPADPPIPDRVLAYGQGRDRSPSRVFRRDTTVVSATDDWPFLYMRRPHLPGHYLGVLALVLGVSTMSIVGVLAAGTSRRSAAYGSDGSLLARARPRFKDWSWHFFFLGAGFMLLETKSMIQFALLWGSTWVVASFVIGSILVMALAANFAVLRIEIRRPWIVTLILIALIGLNYLIPVGRIGLESRALESAVYALLVFSPIFCAGLLFGSSIQKSRSVALDYGANLLGAMLGGITEYLALIAGYQVLLLLVALFYLIAQLTYTRGANSGN